MSENALVPVEALSPAVVFGEGGVDAIVERVKSEVAIAARDLDISTAGGRQKIASIAYKVSRSKTALDDMGKELVSGLKEQAAKIDNERKRIRDSLDAIRDEVRRPLDEWEAAEKRRTEAHEARIKEIEDVAVFDLARENSTAIRVRVEQLRQFEVNTRAAGFQEFGQRYVRALNQAGATLAAALQAAEAREQAEIDEQRRRADEQARLQKEREESIAAEAKAKAEAAAADARKAAEKRAKDAEAATKHAEADRKAAVARAAKAEADKKAVQEKAKAYAKEAAEKAAQRERDRIAAEQSKEAAAADRREASERNRRRVAKAISGALVDAGLTAQQADLALDAIVSGKVPHIKVEW